MRRASGGRFPRFFVWENVPGAFSSNKGLDFQCVLEEIGETEIPMPKDGRWANAGLVELPKCDIAWRVLDAQYWGVPQRRRRIFLVVDFAAERRCAGEILFERKSLFGHTAESGETRERTAAGTESGIGNSSGFNIKASAAAIYDMTHADEVMRRVPDRRAPTLNARMGTGGNQVPVIANNKSVRRLTPTECERLQGLPEVWEVNVGMMTNDEYIAFNLAAGHIVVDCNTGDVFATRGPGGITLDTPRKLKGSIINGYITYSIRNGEIKKPCRANRVVWISANGIIPDGMVVDHVNNDKLDNRLENLQLLSPEDNSHKAKKDGLYLCGDDNPSTKLSCDERLRIFMEYKEGNTSYAKLAEKYKVSKGRIAQIIKRDGYTLIDDKTCSDTARYKALGNGMAAPCADYVIRRIVEAVRDEQRSGNR